MVARDAFLAIGIKLCKLDAGVVKQIFRNRSRLRRPPSKECFTGKQKKKKIHLPHRYFQNHIGHHMKPQFPLALICFSLGFASAWLLRAPAPSDSSKNTAAVDEKTSPSPSMVFSEKGKEKSLSRSARTPNAEADSEQAKALATEMAMDANGKKMLKDMLSKHHHGILNKLARELNLSPAQMEIMRKSLEERIDKILEQESNPESDPSEEMQGLMSPSQIDELLMAQMTEDQKLALRELRTKERQSKIDANTLKSLGQVTEAVSLSEEQRNAVYATLAEAETKKLENQKSNMNFNDIIMESMGLVGQDEFGMHDIMTDPEVQEKMANHPEQMGNMEFRNQLLRESMTKKIDDKVNLISPHLSPEQTTQYRQSLQDKVNSTLGILESMNIQSREN
ncbi:MAG: hypothetical protein EAZ81_01465 [Verrucomicrobia bacterium]|nr:MAG: hypothetical protein EAZ81_01465 [Verrucomicrobiota bacterium]